jgi:hypothetical protein
VAKGSGAGKDRGAKSSLPPRMSAHRALRDMRRTIPPGVSYNSVASEAYHEICWQKRMNGF